MIQLNLATNQVLISTVMQVKIELKIFLYYSFFKHTLHNYNKIKNQLRLNHFV